MRYYLDSADRAAVCTLLDLGVFSGVTTNPTLMAKAGLHYDELPAFYAALVEAGAGEVFVQAAGTTADAIEEHGRLLAAIGDRAVVKVAATPAGLQASTRLARSGIPVLVTAVYTVAQAVAASRVPAAYIAPYVGRLADAGRDGVAIVTAMQAALRGSATQVLAASIRSVDVVDALAVVGVDTVSVSPDLAGAMLSEPATLAAAEAFEVAATALRRR